MRRTLTVNGALELLVADFARQLADSSFFVEFDSHRLFMVTEETGKGGGEWLILSGSR
jgi:hypothetical protein